MNTRTRDAIGITAGCLIAIGGVGAGAYIYTIEVTAALEHALASDGDVGGSSHMTAERQAMLRAERNAVALQRQEATFNRQARQEQDAEITAMLKPQCAEGDFPRQAGFYQGTGPTRIYIPSMWELCQEWHLPVGS